MVLRQRAVIVAGVGLMVSTAAVTALYLPFFVGDDEALRQQRLQHRAAAQGGGSRGSVWKNLDQAVERK